MSDHGRPPSYPTVVTTITTDNGAAAGAGGGVGVAGGAGGNSSNSNDLPLLPPPPSSLEEACRLYERDGDAFESLKACRRLWKSGAVGGAGAGAEFETIHGAGAPGSIANQQLWRRHNQAVLEHLSSLRLQRNLRVRRRPSSFDEGGDNDNESNRDDTIVVKDLESALFYMMMDRSTNPSSYDRQSAVVDEISAKNTSNDSRGDAATATTTTAKKPQSFHSNSAMAKYNWLVVVYNVCISNYAAGDYQKALNIIGMPFLSFMKGVQFMDGVDNNTSKPSGEDIGKGGEGVGSQAARNETTNTTVGEKKNSNQGSFLLMGYLVMMTRIAFLVLDCHFMLHQDHGANDRVFGVIRPDDYGPKDDDSNTITVEEILTWIQNNSFSSAGGGVEGHEDMSNHIQQDELKFRLHLYRARMLILGENNRNNCEKSKDNTTVEARARLSRKELKNAMDIYQNKLCVVGEEEGEEVEEGIMKQQGKTTTAKQSKQGSRGGSKGRSHSKGRSNQDQSETTSVTSMAGGSYVTSTSDALWSEGKGPGGAGGTARATFEGMPTKHNTGQQPQQTPVLSPVNHAKAKKKDATPNLQVRHQSVLYLKANLEYLRGNTSKSLKLCAEARSAGKKSRAIGDPNGHSNDTAASADGDANANASEPSLGGIGDGVGGREGENQLANDYDEAIYYNNLALLHQSAGKIHLAMKYYSYALSYMERVKLHEPKPLFTVTEAGAAMLVQGGHSFWSDGTARPDITPEILHNTSICAFQAQEFNKAYECMSQCVRVSGNLFGKRGRCWLRLGQSCIGIYTNIQQDSKLQESLEGQNNNTTEIDPLYIGSEEDLSNIYFNPLERAITCLSCAIAISSSGNTEFLNAVIPSNSIFAGKILPLLPKIASLDLDLDCLEMSLATLAYVKLQLKDHAGALAICKLTERLHSENANKDNRCAATSLQIQKMVEVYSREATVHTAG